MLSDNHSDISEKHLASLKPLFGTEQYSPYEFENKTQQKKRVQFDLESNSNSSQPRSEHSDDDSNEKEGQVISENLARLNMFNEIKEPRVKIKKLKNFKPLE